MTQRSLLAFIVFVFAGMLHPSANSQETLSDEFQQSIKPILQQHCVECHSGDSSEAKLDINSIHSVEHVLNQWDSWNSMITRAEINEMPPPDASSQPTADQRRLLKDWTIRLRRAEAIRHRGDPGPTSTRRLSNAEWNYAIRDLTGVDIQPAKSFPIDPANAAGFDNSAESLTLSPALFAKYLDAARFIAEHMLLTPEGIRFAPHPVVTDTDRDKYCVQRIVDFYQQQPISLKDYFLAAYRIQKKVMLDPPDANLRSSWIADEATQSRLNAKYLTLVLDTLTASEPRLGALAQVCERWNTMCKNSNDSSQVESECAAIADFITTERQWLKPKIENLQVPGMHGGSQSVVLWKNRKMASARRTCRADLLDALQKDEPENSELRKLIVEGTEEDRERILASYETFCSVFPDAFFILERGRAHIDPEEAAIEGKGRYLSAGFHSMMGYFRDDQPLCELLLDEHQRAVLDQLWLELDFISQVPIRQYSGFIWFERAESSFINEPVFNFIRAEDKSASSPEMIDRFATLYLDKVRRKSDSTDAHAAVEFYFQDMNRQIQEMESRWKAAEAVQVEALKKVASKAFRRPISDSESSIIQQFYEESQRLPNATHRTAMEDTLVFLLMSQDHLFRWDLQCDTDQSQKLTPLELASRLSFFLWSSAPDEVLLNAALAGELQKPEELERQLKRMLDDSRSRGMVREFMGNWLDFRRFDSHQGVDRNQFPQFDDELRQAMADEPIEFFLQLVQNNGNLLELVDSNRLIVNDILAEHYGVNLLPESPEASPGWHMIDGAHDMNRGGLIPMAVFLTQNSPGLRTSPVKRGYWVVRKFLGEDIPPPPPNVPELPESEHDLGDLTLRELLAKHREHASCAACHDRFDAAGLLLEGYDPIGLPRSQDLGGKPIAIDAKLPNGIEAVGLAGLKAYIKESRIDDFRRHYCESLLAYALGRSLIISDDLLVEEMLEQLKSNEDRVQVAFLTIIKSQQFQNKRAANQAKESSLGQ